MNKFYWVDVKETDRTRFEEYKRELQEELDRLPPGGELKIVSDDKLLGVYIHTGLGFNYFTEREYNGRQGS
jgi:hypothetical protein